MEKRESTKKYRLLRQAGDFRVPFRHGGARISQVLVAAAVRNRFNYDCECPICEGVALGEYIVVVGGKLPKFDVGR
jgi:hypothetical protein